MAPIDLRTGERVWEQEIGSTHGPWVAGDFVFVLANDNEAGLPARATTGKVPLGAPAAALSRTRRTKSAPICWAGPVLGGNRLIVVVLDRRHVVAVALDRRHARPAVEISDGALSRRR